MYKAICMPSIDELAYLNVHFGIEFTSRRIFSMSHLKHIRVIAPLTVFLVILTAVATAGSGLVRAASAVSPLVLVSGPSPYASCTIGGTSSSTNSVNAEVEPYVAVNPTNHSNIIGVWQQDRWNDGGAHGLVAGFSTGGGLTWSETPLPFSACANGLGFERASDPWVSIGPDGTAYAVSISFNQVANADNSVAAAMSTDGGKTWSSPHLVDLITGPDANRLFDDKESVTADPTKPGVAYVVWDRFTGGHNDNP